MHILLVTSFPVLVRNLSAKCKWQDALCEGVNGRGRGVNGTHAEAGVFPGEMLLQGTDLR